LLVDGGFNPVRASSPIGRIATVDHQDHARGHRSCVSVSEAPSYRKLRQGCISIVPVGSTKGALCNEKVLFMFRIEKSLWLRAAQLWRPAPHEELVSRVNGGYSSQEEVFGDAVEQGIKVRCQTGCACHERTNISLL
jgi:hypothetical protein